MIYADYNATSPLRPEARAAILERMERTGNPSSVHAYGRSARAAVEQARDAVAGAVGACRDDLAFVSGGTEANQAPIRGAIAAAPDLHLLASAVEHESIAALVGDCDRVPVDSRGVIDLGALRDLCAEVVRNGRRPLVSLMLVNNETGVVQPVAEAGEVVHASGGFLHCDAVQAMGRLAVSVFDLNVDFLSLSSHKVGGPQGVGAVYFRSDAPFRPMLSGGGQEFGRRAGTENVAGVAGFAAAVLAAVRDLPSYRSLAAHRNAMEARLKAAAPRLVVHGETAERAAGVSCFGLAGWRAETQVMALDLAGAAVSAGAACSSGKVGPSRVLLAMGCSGDDARCAIRVSFGWATRLEEIEQLASLWIGQASRARPSLVAEREHHHAGR